MGLWNKIKIYFQKVKHFTAQKYGKQGVFTNAFMILTVASGALVIASQRFIFSLITLFLAIMWAIFANIGGKKDFNSSQEYSSPDLEGIFLHWLSTKIKQLFKKL